MNTIRLERKQEETPAEFRRDELTSEDALVEIDLAEILRMLLRQKKVIAATTFLIMLLTFVVLTSLTPRYIASVFVEIDARQSRVVNYDAVLTGLSADNETMQTEIQIIQSRKIAGRTIEHLKLNRFPEFNPAMRRVGLLKSWRNSLSDWLAGYGEAPSEGSQSDLDQEAEEPVGLFYEMVHALAGYLAPPADESVTADDKIRRSKERVIDEFLESLIVESEGGSRIVRISFESESPKTAAAAANSIADFYIVAQLEAKFEATKRASTWLNERVLQLRQEVVSKERAIEEYRAVAGLLRGGANTTLASEQISELNTQHVLEVARLAEARARLRQANRLLDLPGGIESSVDVLQSALIQQFRGEEALIERKIAELAEEYGERHPQMLSARAELQDLRTKIKLEVARVIEGLRNIVAVAAARATSLEASLVQHKQKIAQLNQSEVELRALELDANASRTLLENLLERTKQTMSQESFQQADANIVSSAVEPRIPSFPRKFLIMSIMFLLAVILGVFLAVLMEQRDLGFRSGEQVLRILGLKPLGLLPRVSMIAAAGKEPPDYVLKHPDSAFAEGIRSLYTNILLTDVVRRPKVIMMVSALPNEGKTTVTLALARLLATANYKVVVVDCDLRNPMVHKKLGLEPGPGLMECLTSGVAIGEVIQEDKASGAHILRAGTVNHNSLRQFDSDLMQKMLRQLSRQYDLVLLDSAPLFAISDSLFLARLADKTVFIAQWAKTPRRAVRLAIEQALDADADIAGVLLTMVDIKSHATYGYGDSGVYHGKFRKYFTS